MTEQQHIELDALLKQGILLLESLNAIYDQELEAVSSKNLERLTAITQEKMGVINKFHAFTQDRVALLNSFGINIDAEEYSAPDDSSAHSQQSNALYTEIKRHLKELQHKNKRNEQAISRNQQNVSQLLAIARGHTKEDQLYNKAGGSGLYKAQSSLGKA